MADRDRRLRKMLGEDRAAAKRSIGEWRAGPRWVYLISAIRNHSGGGFKGKEYGWYTGLSGERMLGKWRDAKPFYNRREADRLAERLNKLTPLHGWDFLAVGTVRDEGLPWDSNGESMNGMEGYD